MAEERVQVLKQRIVDKAVRLKTNKHGNRSQRRSASNVSNDDTNASGGEEEEVVAAGEVAEGEGLGLSGSQLKSAGFTACELFKAGFTIQELKVVASFQ